MALIETFRVGQAIRYKPGNGTYGYEDALEADGRVQGIVLGHTPTRVRVQLELRTPAIRRSVTRSVDAASLIAQP
jgi:hypothetical protein